MHAEGNEVNKELMRWSVGRDFGGDSRYCLLCSRAGGFNLGLGPEHNKSERCPLPWSGVRPKVHQCWDCLWAEVTQSSRCAPCFGAVESVGFYRQGLQLRNCWDRIRSQHLECLHRRFGLVCALLVEAPQFVPEWARGPRNEAGSPKGLVSHPLNQMWESIGSDSCNRNAGLVKVPFLLCDDIGAPDRNPPAHRIEQSVFVDPVGQGSAEVRGFWWAGLGCCDESQDCYQQQPIASPLVRGVTGGVWHRMLR